MDWRVFIFLLTSVYVNAQSCHNPVTIAIDRPRVDNKFCDNTSKCTSLKIVSSVLEVIPHELEQCYPNLLELDVKYCQIAVIETTLKHTKLKKLNLAHNQLEVVNDYDFSGVSNLSTLDLSFNQIMNLQLEVFNGLKLTCLNISNNRILTISSYSNERIDCCITIVTLNLSKNFLTNVVRLRNFIALRDLDLSENAKLEMDYIPFAHMTNLTFLKLNNANLNDDSKLRFLAPAQNLQKLSIAENNFQPLNISMLPVLKELRRININGLNFVNFTYIVKRLPNLKRIEMFNRFWTCDFLNEISKFTKDHHIVWLNSNQTTSCIGQDSKTDLWIALSITGILLATGLIAIILVHCKRELEKKRYQTGVQLNVNPLYLDDGYDDDRSNEYDYHELQESFYNQPHVEPLYMDVYM